MRIKKKLLKFELRSKKGVFLLTSPNSKTSAWYVETKLHPPLVRQDTVRRPYLEQELCRSVGTLTKIYLGGSKLWMC